ncbi:hypothetical protein PCANC_27926 [Puccinia coronata f. sp. avenae]|uniref:Uncharacterized protein n=1 Tax=Puccinia coronata f. sp. avenae TaxID=200324 RepID=A0A2N5S655_9BASI|nr:hypothetical protein PCANC_27926 [Puccinia coronata f. sp. avenae]
MVSQVRQIDARADALKPSDSGAAGSVTKKETCGDPRAAKTQHHHRGLNHHQGLKRLRTAYNPARRAHQTPSEASDEQLFYQGQLGASGSMTQSVQLTHNGDCVNWTLLVLEPEASD